MATAIAAERGPQRRRLFASTLAGVCLVMGLGLAATPAEAAPKTKVMSQSFSNVKACRHAYHDAVNHLINLGYERQTHQSTCGRKWTWRKGYVWEYKVTGFR